jgi:hypothetical protein
VKACCNSVRNIFPSNLLSKNIEFKTDINIIWSVVFSGFETWSFTLMKKLGLRVFENRFSEENIRT